MAADRLTLRNVYLYLVCLITLVVSLFAAVSLVRSTVGLFYPDPGYYGYYPYEQVLQELVVESPMLGVSKAWFAAAMPVGLALMLIHVLRAWLDDYWAGRAPLDTLVFSITPDASVRWQKLQAGECHVAPYPNPADIEALKADPNLVMMEQEGLNVGYLAYNTQMAPFDNPKVRIHIDDARHFLRTTERKYDLVVFALKAVAEVPVVGQTFGWSSRVVADDTAVVFVSDHGFYFGEHDYFGKAEWINDQEAALAEDSVVPDWLPESWLLCPTRFSTSELT